MEVEQKLGKSLDDLIKETKKPRAAGGKKGAKGKVSSSDPPATRATQ